MEECWFPKGGTKYFDKALRRTFHSKDEKKKFLKENGLRENYIPDESHKKNLLKMHEEVEEGRKKQGLKPREAEIEVKKGFYSLKYKDNKKWRE